MTVAASAPYACCPTIKMAQLFYLLGVIVAVAETKPLAPRPAASPWPAIPSTETVRSLHKLLPQPHDEQMSEEQIAARFGDFLRARGGRFEPFWANHSHAERSANLQEHRAKRQLARLRRRRMQRWATGVDPWADDSAQAKDTGLAAVLGAPSFTCDDPLATNAGRSPPCTYDCADLQQAYFPAPQSQTTRCFLFDPATETWPEVGGEEAELLSMRQQRFETHTYISRVDGTNPPLSGLSFSIGDGRVCKNVTIRSTFLGTGDTHIEEVCLVDGEHEYNHTINEAHTVEVVGYAESDVHEEASGTTAFVVGECTDVLIRVTTTSAGGESVSWSLDDGGHNGPWLFDSVEAVYEQETCMFDNDFTLTKLSAPASWQGSVEVVGFIHYHNTITIPNDENWIVQGIVHPVSGLPSSMDARLKSGTAIDRSHANIILRNLRISGQVAPVEVNAIPRATAFAGMTDGYGGAFEYDGGSSDPSNLVQIVFDQIVFDHNAAGSCAPNRWMLCVVHWPLTMPGGKLLVCSAGGAVLIDGRAGRLKVNSARQNWGTPPPPPPPPPPPRTNAQSFCKTKKMTKIRCPQKAASR
eukprot:COSAG04_NODE_689_length_11142_cov_6.664041_7_plen_583_part_00